MIQRINISIATDFSDAPGARFRDDGDDSGQEFYEDLLRPKFLEAVAQKAILFIDLDGTYGYATSFISYSFGSLSREFGKENVIKTLELKSDEDEKLVDYVKKTIESPDEFI